ncbi:hypothetical protein E4U33_001410 [Claviceps sp. LM78 group G4]|nr:hypothetical protein E4U33_001410 [Claviceps sp. LM78 group G4]
MGSRSRRRSGRSGRRPQLSFCCPLSLGQDLGNKNVVGSASAFASPVVGPFGLLSSPAPNCSASQLARLSRNEAELTLLQRIVPFKKVSPMLDRDINEPEDVSHLVDIAIQHWGDLLKGDKMRCSKVSSASFRDNLASWLAEQFGAGEESKPNGPTTGEANADAEPTTCLFPKSWPRLKGQQTLSWGPTSGLHTSFLHIVTSRDIGTPLSLPKPKVFAMSSRISDDLPWNSSGLHDTNGVDAVLSRKEL